MLKEGVGDHRHQRMPVKTLPGPAFEVIETEFFFHLLMGLFVGYFAGLLGIGGIAVPMVEALAAVQAPAVAAVAAILPPIAVSAVIKVAIARPFPR